MTLAQIKKAFGPRDSGSKEKLPDAGMSFTARYALWGALFGLLFPLLAMSILFLMGGMSVNLASIIEVQRTQPLLWIIDTAPLFLGVFASFAGRREDKLRQAYRLLQQEKRELRELAEQLQLRTEQLLVSADISSYLSTILNLEELLAEAVTQIKDKFGYYHANIYLLDREDRKLVAASETDGAGIETEPPVQSILLGASTSFVARAARTGETVRIDNVREERDWLPDPLLPHTYAEMAVPIILGEQVVGVLDVQEDEIAGLDEGDAALLRSLAHQVAVAIRNARLFEEVETGLVEARATQERYLEQAWEKTRVAPRGGQYLYVAPNTTPPGEKEQSAIMAEVEQKAQAQRHSIVMANESLGGESLVAPINLRNKTIGALHLHAAGEGLLWNEDDVTLVETVVDQLAQTAENLRLFEETRQRAGREQTIRQIADKLRAATNLDALLETAARELGQRLGVRHTVLELGIEAESGAESTVTGEKV